MAEKLVKSARVHSKTVTKVSKGQVRSMKKPTPRSASKNSRVTIIEIDPQVWKKAIELAEHQVMLIEVIDSKTVVVHNHKESRRRAAERNLRA